MVARFPGERLRMVTVAGRDHCARSAFVLFWTNLFGNGCQTPAERHVLSRWPSYGECMAKFDCLEL
jgi:hypothetical protein